jgi:enterochelin esterase-like enzyme
VTARPDAARRSKLWIDIGSNDRWAAGAEDLHRELERLGIAHAWREPEGDHVSSYWTANLPDYLRFYGSALAAR